ncbi:hypothetical protein D3C84_666170 [compost metagenome]
MRMLMDVTRQHFFTGPGLTGDQHRRITARHPCGQFQQLRTGRLERYRPLAVGSAEAAQRMPRNQIQQSLGLERLDQIIRRALTHRIDRALDGTVGRHQQHRQLRLASAQQSEQLMAVHARHVHVTEHQVERLGSDGIQRFFGRPHGCVVMPCEQQRIGQCFA